jgi:glycosyltransferase involved in cell wall biosynthesis
LPNEARHPRLRLTGYLDTLDDILHESRVFIAPLLSGTGTRIKLIEAMAYGMPIVSTSKGAEGLAILPGRHMLIADTPVDFANAVSRLLEDTALCESLGVQARELVRTRYTWDASGNELRQLVRSLLETETNAEISPPAQHWPAPSGADGAPPITEPV